MPAANLSSFCESGPISDDLHFLISQAKTNLAQFLAKEPTWVSKIPIFADSEANLSISYVQTVNY